MTTHYAAIQGSTTPALLDTLRQADGSAVDLTDATVVLRLEHESTGQVVEFAMTVADAESGAISRQWSAGDLQLTPGRWLGQYRVTRGGAIEIWPLPTPTNLRDAWGRFGLSFEISRAIVPA